MLHKNIVIYIKKSKGGYTLFRDFRTVQDTSVNIFVMITLDGKLFLSKCCDKEVIKIEQLPPFINVTKTISPITYNWLIGISILCNTTSVNTNLQVKNHTDLFKLSPEIFSLWKKRILIVSFSSYKRLYATKTKASTYSGKNVFFSILGYIAERDFILSSDTSFDYIVCFYSPNMMCFLDVATEELIKNSLVNRKNLDKISDNNYQKLKNLTLEEKLKCKEEKNKQKPQKKADLIEKLCKCDICKKKDYNENMSKAGPEQLDIVEPHISSLLEMLNLNTNINIQIVEQLCELSVAAFDIESMTISTDHLHSDEQFPISEIENRGTEMFTKKVQKPIMISHCDSLSEEEALDLTFTAKSDKEEDIYNMMVEYWDVICIQAEKAVKKKKEIALPILSALKAYSQAFFDLCGGLEGPDGKMKEGNWESAWKKTLFGKLETGLCHLIEKYVIFSFYG